jgi:hypothetical protein
MENFLVSGTSIFVQNLGSMFQLVEFGCLMCMERRVQLNNLSPGAAFASCSTW